MGYYSACFLSRSKVSYAWLDEMSLIFLIIERDTLQVSFWIQSKVGTSTQKKISAKLNSILENKASAAARMKSYREQVESLQEENISVLENLQNKQEELATLKQQISSTDGSFRKISEQMNSNALSFQEAWTLHCRHQMTRRSFLQFPKIDLRTIQIQCLLDNKLLAACY